MGWLCQRDNWEILPTWSRHALEDAGERVGAGDPEAHVADGFRYRGQFLGVGSAVQFEAIRMAQEILNPAPPSPGP